MKTPQPISEVSATGRRRLLRGAFAVPVIATVHSGAALATSSSLRCLANSTHVPGVVNAPDNYLRVQLGCRTKNSDNSKTYYVDGNTVKAAATSMGCSVSSTCISANKYKLFTINNNIMSGSEITTPASSGYKYAQNGGKYAALMFTSDGKTICGVGITSQAHAATQSCWGSFT